MCSRKAQTNASLDTSMGKHLPLLCQVAQPLRLLLISKMGTEGFGSFHYALQKCSQDYNDLVTIWRTRKRQFFPFLHPPHLRGDCSSHHSLLLCVLSRLTRGQRTLTPAPHHHIRKDQAPEAEDSCFTHTSAYPHECLWGRPTREDLFPVSLQKQCGNNHSSMLIYPLNTFQDILTKTDLIFISGGKF